VSIGVNRPAASLRRTHHIGVRKWKITISITRFLTLRFGPEIRLTFKKQFPCSSLASVVNGLLLV